MASAETEKKRQRRALSHVGGAVELVGGSATEQRALALALGVEPAEQASMAHLHGFHSYPARLHPATASALIEAFSRPGQAVLDPFCGSGTVIIEALRLGRRALGVDANPLAVELVWLKTQAPRAPWLSALAPAAERAAAHADARRKARAGATRRYPEEDVALFAPHVLLELDGLRDGIARIAEPEVRRALGLALSSILTKVSQRAGDASGRLEAKRIAAGYSIKLFTRKVDELVRRAAELDALLPASLPHSYVELGDARRIGFARPGSIDLVVSSPPYAGVYDYYSHHEARLRWLGLPAARFQRSEIGSRRQGKSGPDALARFKSDFSACLAEMARVVSRRGKIALIVADSVLGSRPLYADELIDELAPRAGLRLLARASQRRPHFHRPTRQAFERRPRSEHLILLAAADSSLKTRAARRAPPWRDRRSGGRRS